MSYVLGDIVFERPAESPQSEGYSRSHTYAEMKPAIGKPILQRKGANLTNLDVSMYFHTDFCEPSIYIERLFNMMDSGEIVEYYHDNGEFKGNFVILDVRVRVEKRFPGGRLMAATVDVSMKEYSEAQFLRSVKQEFETPEIPDPETEVPAPVKKAAPAPFQEVKPADMGRQSFNDAREVLQHYDPEGESRL
ncbi:phage tail protein [bacterium]|nr:phage tail protein [bacterium]MBP5435984.1 phage tail protein [bacterium]